MPRHKPSCVECQTALRPEVTGAYLLETAGKEQRPYKLWSCDIWKCPECGKEIAHGFSLNALHHCSEDFDRMLNIARGKDRLYFDHEYPAGGETCQE